MAYLARCDILHDDAYFHVTWKCHNEDWLLKEDWAKKLYYGLLLKYKDKYGVQFHSYNFMDNHPHLIGHLRTVKELSGFFQVVNSQFALKFNKKMGRRGQVIMDRPKSPLIESDEHMLNAMAYADLNQHRVGKVSHPRDNKWSSYRYYAYGEPDPLITPSPSYEALGDTPEERRREYRFRVEAIIENRQMLNISHTHFIGDPDWVLMKYCELCEKLDVKMRISKLIQMTSPPPA